MMTTHLKSTLLLMTGLAALISGPAQAQVQNQSARPAQDSPEVVYFPKPLPGIATLDSVRDDLAVLLRGRIRPVAINCSAFARVDIYDEVGKKELSALLEGGGHVSTTWGELPNGQYRIDYILYNNVSVLEEGIKLAPQIFLPYDKFLNSPITVEIIKGVIYPYIIRLQNQLSFRFDAKDLADAKRMADDLYFLQQQIPKQEVERATRAKALAAEYRALKTKPPVSEEQRRFIVQANSMNQQQDYGNALAHYQKALDLQPLSYPAAYFNMALISAQLRRYRQAIAYMNQYLLLEPEAKDARSAQDKIYEWEIMLGR